jgi:hypothetical protein
VTPSTLRGHQVHIRKTNPALVAQAAVVAVTVGTLWFSAGRLAAPGTVEASVVNDTAYDVDVVVSADGGGGRQPFGRVEAESTRVQPHFLDPGDSWVVSFTYGSNELGELRLTGADLDRDGHTIRVPPEVVTRAQALGLEPPPL